MTDTVTVLGGGCTGPLLATLLAGRGHAVHIYERRADARRVALPAGRSINLALAARGIAGLERAGLMDAVRPLLLPMRGRMLHDPGGGTRLLPYGQRPHELLWSVSRADLNRVLIDAAEARGVQFHFGHACRGVDFDRGQIALESLVTGARVAVPLGPVIGADGAYSSLRDSMVGAGLGAAREETLEHGYKELTIPAGPSGKHRLETGALHVWPRGGYMLIALPNSDGTFTATLFLATAAERVSFASLTGATEVTELFARDFPDALALIPDLTAQFAANPVGRMSTIYAAPWHVGGQALLIGDAAHAIVPFHGQGMNCAFEDCRVLDELVAAGLDWPGAFAEFDALRREDTAAIARMAVGNYTEMRDTVRDARFALQRELSLELERRHPDRFIPRYSMVMFHSEITYAAAERRGALQAAMLDEATRSCTRLDDVDLPRIEAAVLERLSPLIPPAAPA
jgi:kynurenine 3-monooxygenase